MEIKLKYLNLIKKAHGGIDEIELGEKSGLNEDETRSLISLLLSEHRIVYEANTYRIIKRSRKRNRR
jgi:hypothetical protein